MPHSPYQSKWASREAIAYGPGTQGAEEATHDQSQRDTSAPELQRPQSIPQASTLKNTIGPSSLYKSKWASVVNGAHMSDRPSQSKQKRFENETLELT